MSKRLQFIAAAILIVIIAGSVFLLRSKKDPSNKEIRSLFSCDRITQEARYTDRYCSDPDLYRQGLKNSTHEELVR